jgi:hypothetical protein
MLLQTNSYVVPKEKRAEHARLMRRFRQALMRLGCDQFEVYEQVGANWSSSETSERFVQIMRFRDRKHQLAVQNAERSDPTAQSLIAEFCELVNFAYQQQQGLFAVGFYNSVLPVAPTRLSPNPREPEEAALEEVDESEDEKGGSGEHTDPAGSAAAHPSTMHASEEHPVGDEINDIEFGESSGGEEAA